MRIPETYSSFIKKSAGYVIFNLVEKIAPFILLPIIIRKVSVEGYGNYSFFLTLESVLIPILTLNLSNCIYREYYQHKTNLREYISNLVYGYFLLAAVMSVPFIVLVVLFHKTLDLTYQICLCLFFTALFSSFAEIVSMIFRLEQKVISYGVWQVFRSVFMLLLLVVSVFINGTYENLVYTRLIALSIVFLIVFVILNRKRLIGSKLDKAILKYMLQFSLPTVVYSLAGFALSFSDRFFIKSILGGEALGIYSGIYQLSAAIAILVTAINSAWMPWMFDKLSAETDESKIEVVKVSYFMTFGLVGIGALWGAAFPLLAKFMLTDAFSHYLFISWIFIFAFVFHGIYSIVSPYTFYVGKTKTNATIGIVSATVNIVLNAILVPSLGVVGPAISLLITWFIQATMFFLYGQKYYPMPWNLRMIHNKE